MNSFKWCGKRVTYLVETKLLSVIWWHGRDMADWGIEFVSRWDEDKEEYHGKSAVVFYIGRLTIHIGRGAW